MKLPYSQHGVKILNTGINLIYEIPQLNVVIKFGITGFTVNLPFKNFGGNTQGHCGENISLKRPILVSHFSFDCNIFFLTLLVGTCNNNQADDCMLPDGRLVKNCAVMADYWPAKHIYQPGCQVPSVPLNDKPEPIPNVTPCKPDSICDILKSR